MPDRDVVAPRDRFPLGAALAILPGAGRVPQVPRLCDLRVDRLPDQRPRAGRALAIERLPVDRLRTEHDAVVVEKLQERLPHSLLHGSPREGALGVNDGLRFSRSALDSVRGKASDQEHDGNARLQDHSSYPLMKII